MKTTLFSILVLAATVTAAHADPVTAMVCVSQKTGSFAVVGIKTGLFAPSTQHILQYEARVGKLSKTGEIATEKFYELESNMKIFDSSLQAYNWVIENTVVIPLTEEGKTHGTLLVDRGKKKVSVIDLDYETIETLDCLAN